MHIAPRRSSLHAYSELFKGPSTHASKPKRIFTILLFNYDKLVIKKYKNYFVLYH